MKILLINNSDVGGGAAVATIRLLKTLNQSGIQVDLGVVEKNTSQPNIICLKKDNFLKKILRRWHSGLIKFCFRTTNPIMHSENKQTLLDIEKINNSDYDLIHLHWVNYDTVSIEDIVKIRKPLAWTLHDSWVFCGAEHYQNVLENDQRFIEGYMRKNKPLTTKGLDICRKTWEHKKKAWKNLRCAFISPSSFEKKCFTQSALFRNGENGCVVIPNIVPENIFKPLDRTVLRQKYGIPKNKKVIGFGALDVSNKKSVKGGYLFLEALQKIQQPQDFHLVVFGRMNISFSKIVTLPIFAAGYIKEQERLVELYNLCDVYVCPSLIESFGLTCLEAAFCGVPVAAFNTGGIPDIVEHQRTGYLAKPFEVDDLVQGIIYCLDNKNRLSKNSLAKARQDFNNRVVLEKHISFYENVLKSRQEK